MRTPHLFRHLLGLLASLVLLTGFGCGKEISAPTRIDRLVVVQGADQAVQVGRALPTPVILRAVDSLGRGMSGRTINLVIGAGGGTVTPTSAETNELGEVSAAWTLGPTATLQTLLASATGLEPVLVEATGLVPIQVVIAQGNNQTGRAGVALATQIVIRVLGPNNVPMVGIPVALQVTGGGGSFTPQTANTNTTGEVTVRWTTGTVPGVNTAVVQVWTLDPVALTATGTP